MCVEIEGVKMLTFFGVLLFVGFINPIGVVAGLRRQETSSLSWDQLSRFHLKTETEFSLRNVVF
jgi:hypothetical protein